MKFTGFLPLALAASLLTGPAANAAEKKKAAAPAAKSKPAKPEETTPAAPAEPSPEAALAALPEVVAVVEGAEIKKGDLDVALNSVLAQQGRSAAEIPAEQKPMIYRMVLDDLITEKLISKRAQELKVDDAEVDAIVTRAQSSVGKPEDFKAQLEKSGQTLDTLKESIRVNLRERHWIDSQLQGKAAVTDKEAEDFYKQNSEQFKQPEMVRASHILVAVSQDAKPETVVEKEKSATAILERVKKGEPFEKLAAELSEDPSAKQNKGDLDFFGREQMVPEFSEAAFKMKKDEVSAEPVRSQFGYHIIKVTDRKAPETVPFEKAKPQLVAYLTNQKKQQEIEKVVKAMRAKAEVKVNLPDLPAPADPTDAAAPDAAAPAPPK